MRQPRLLGAWDQWAALALCAALGAGLFTFVDLTPQVQADFFFSTDDPQLKGSLEIDREFGQAQQILVAARAPELATRPYLEALHALTEDLRTVEGVTDVRSLTRGPFEPGAALKEDPERVFKDLQRSPFWKRLLLAPDRSATFALLRLEGKQGDDRRETVAALDRVLDRHSRPGFEVGASGVPYVSEHIRIRLIRDLRLFTVAAFVAFALLVTVLFRSMAVLLGTMVASLTASFATFLARAALGMKPDVLTPNLWMIAFVLTLSHVVYLTAEWRRRAGGTEAVEESKRANLSASAWSLAANLLGFASLFFVSAKPLRQFGVSGALAAVIAFACAFCLYPAFLRAARANGARKETGREYRGMFTTRHRLFALSVVVTAIALAPLAWHANTDPSLPSYFSSGDRIRAGFDPIDRTAGSSALDLVVADAQGRRLDDDEAFERLKTLQRRLEQHPDVGMVLSIALLMAEADRPWYSFLVSWEGAFDRMDRRKNDRIGRTFVSEDRRRGRFILRMHEAARTRPRVTVVGEIHAMVREQGFTPVRTGGLYVLQGELSTLVEGSVLRGLGGLLACFFVMVLIVTRSFWSALLMTVCLAITPLVLFGTVAIARMPLDIISAPAANVALPLGIDEMIHLGTAVRRLRKRGGDLLASWQKALARLWRPILASMLIVASGFALFLLSSFPPTRRLGLLVCAGAVLTDLAVLVVLPALVTIRTRSAR